ncbi:restriction endonuclease subunit S [Bifidobacterium asteroides]|nr:restriction endonuclease subunit S [Bifidobacterium asteroides]MCP8615180.1 restriction endonuclease subunit S [Bifidobacterium asteroides]
MSMRMPGLRFKADDGSEFPDWEERTSVELCSRMIGGGTPSTSNTDNYNGDISWISSSDLDVDNITTVRRTRFITERAITTSATKKVKPGSIAVVLRVGVGKVALLDRETCTSQDFISLEDVTGDTKFIAYMLSARMQREAVRTQGTSIKGIPATRFKELTYRMPSSIIEQRKIADLLSTVDDVIAVQQAEVDAWEQRKKGVMQKLFSQEVRFKADDGSDFPDWERKKLGEICEYGRQRGIGAHYVGTQNMFKDFRGIAINDPEAEASGSLYFEGDTLMSNIRPYLKKAWKANCNGVCSTDVLVFHPTNVESDYLHCIIASDSFVTYVMSAAKGSKMPRGDKAHIMHMPLILPSLPEQRKIADCLSSIDDIIIKARAELTKWQELKKGLLQQMFV